VLDAATGAPISRAVIDAHHADHNGQYDQDGFDYRGRILTDERGQYEFETIRPDGYGPAPHIHIVVTAPGYRPLTTEILFRDADHPTPRPELTPTLRERTTRGNVWLEGTFDIKLSPQR
jgi:protocatechuate 3,4-dioxygenase beta subunit